MPSVPVRTPVACVLRLVYPWTVPRISEFLGIYIYMYFSDHRPPHFHAIYGRYDAAIDITTGEIVKGSLPNRARGLVREWANLYRQELSANWECARNHDPLLWIPPLE